MDDRRGGPPRRDSDEPNWQLVSYRLGELSELTRSSFDKLDARASRIEERIHSLELASVRHEARVNDMSGPDWMKIILALVAIIGTALTIIAQKGF